MLQEQNLHGIYVPVVTPFHPDETLDLDSYRRLVTKLVDSPIHGLIIHATTGESPAVPWDEAVQLMQVTREILNERHLQLPLVIGTGTSYTRSTIQQTEQAAKLGADAVLISTPSYSRPSEAGVLEHFRQTSQVGIPVIAYENPSRTGKQLTVDTIRRILDLDGVIGLKDSSGGIALLSELTRAEKKPKPILCGDDRWFYAMLCHGAAGGILASAAMETEHFLQVYRLTQEGDFTQAKLMFDQLIPLIQKLFRESNPAPLKWVLRELGLLTSDTLRLPMTSITEDLQRELKAWLDENRA